MEKIEEDFVLLYFITYLLIYFNLFYILLIRMEKIEEDVKQLEQDLEQIRCNPIIQFFKDLFKCIDDCIAYMFKKNE